MEYFGFWVVKTTADKVLVDYKRLLDQVILEAESLRKSLAKKIGRKL